MEVSVTIGDVLTTSAEVLVCPANPWLNMSGGVNGEMLLRDGPAIQEELKKRLAAEGKPHLPPGSVVDTSAGGLDFKRVVHAVAINGFYESSPQMVSETLQNAWRIASRWGSTVAMPALATGYGRLSVEEFSEGFCAAWGELIQLPLSIRLVLRDQEGLDDFSLVAERMLESPKFAD